MSFSELPLGFGMALIQNELAMKQFELLSESEKQDIIQRAHNVESKKEMQRLVSGLFTNGPEAYL